MVLATATALIVDHIPSSRWLPYVSSATLVYAVRKWAGGYRSREDRDLHNKTFILVGAFSGSGLALFHNLAARGAQIIALHPDPSSPQIQQIIYLLRSTSDNERIYADECDMRSLGSIRKFVQVWEKDGRMGMVSDLEARIEAVIFCDGEGSGMEEMGVGTGKRIARKTANKEEEQELYHATLSTHRHAFIQLLLPTLLRSSVAAPVRIIHSFSPFYSAGSIAPTDLDYQSRRFPSRDPWRAEGAATLCSIALMRELHERVETSSQGRIIVLGVCGGFTRSYWRHILRASPSHPHFSFLGLLIFLLLLPFFFLFTKSAEEASQTLVAVVLGSIGGQKKVVQMVGDEVLLEDEEETARREKLGKPTERGEDRDERVPLKVRGGMIYREGREIRIKKLESYPTLGPDLWKIESKTVDRLLKEAVAVEEREGKEKLAAQKAAKATAKESNLEESKPKQA